MKNVLPNKERGVVMILILVFLTMFAIMISAFLFMTSSMSDSAANALALYEKGESAEDRRAADIDNAIRTLVVGTNNTSSPIGPFGILENLYGEQTTLKMSDGKSYDPLALKLFNLDVEFDDEGKTPTKAIIEIFLDGTADYGYYVDRMWFPADMMKNCLSCLPDYEIEQDPSDIVAEFILNSGTFINFGSIRWNNEPDFIQKINFYRPPQALRLPELYDGVCKAYQDYVSGTTAPIIGRTLVNDRGRGLKILKVEVALTEGLKKFLPVLSDFQNVLVSAGMERQWPFFTALPYQSYDQLFELSANLRFNPRHFSGTGAGGATPNDSLDGQVAPLDESPSSPLVDENNEIIKGMFFPEEEKTSNPFRLPFAFWGNAAAPDLTPYVDSNRIPNFQTYWQHLADSKYRVYAQQDGNDIRPKYDGEWEPLTVTETKPSDSILLNPSYTAPDIRTLFLAALNENGKIKDPSFLRTDTLQKIGEHYKNPSSDIKISEAVRLPALLRKVTPRPLHIDHWKWTGGLNDFTPSNYEMNDKNPVTVFEKTLGELDYLSNNAKDVGYDVDNDNDKEGKKEGIWIPSGLPIRVNENGTPYATMYSFTVLDMDGRVNVNTAGNWDQCADLAKYSSVMESGMELTKSSPWFTFENLGDGIRWKDDENVDITTNVKRGTGLGPAGVDLTAALEQISANNPDTHLDKAAAQRIICARWLSSVFRDLSPTHFLFDGIGEDPNANEIQYRRGQLAQPSAYYTKPRAERTDPTQWNPDDGDEHRRFYLYTDAVYRDKNTTETAPNLFLFPWRGKTRVFNYDIPYDSYPTFDFCDTALRSYDPLGNDILTYLPKYSENPYLVNPYGASNKDSTFTVEMLEALLRPFDYDRKNQNTALLEALQINDPEKRNSCAREITTISSDIPVPASTFSVGTKEVHDTVSGLRELIRRCVVLEIYKANKDHYGTAYIDGVKGVFKDKTKVRDGEESEEWRSRFRAYLRERIEDDIKKFKSKVPTAYSPGDKNAEDAIYKNAVDAITDQLFSMLPLDIREGRRLDLNSLSHKACWIDSVYKEQGDGATYVRTRPYSTVDVPNEEFEYYHHLGLAERMKFARGLYILLMALTYEDRNAETVHEFYDNDPSAPLSEYSYEDYMEGYLEPESSDTGSEPTDKKLAAELMANRLAQYCVNLVDFSDPDATMTPFFYDPNPFDGWWAYKDKDDYWLTHEPGETASFLDFVLYTPGTDPNGGDRDFYDALIPAAVVYNSKETNDIEISFEDTSSFLSTPDAPISDRCLEYINSDLPVTFVNDEEGDNRDRFSQALVAWLNGQSLDNPGVGQDDFGMRLVWGMERPDLLLTETLAFHDLGIANTSFDDNTGTRVINEDESDNKDEDFDQVRRPLGSAYLELYCAANPNVPQSPELYEFDKERNLWKLLLWKMTPRQKADSPYFDKELEFPIWRVAITASTDPRGNEEEKNFGNDDIPYKRTIRKKENSVLERLVGDDVTEPRTFTPDPRTFSFRTRQFCDLTFDDSGEKSLDTTLDSKWRGYDYSVSNILGPCAEPNSDGQPNFKDEVEIDRIVWFGWPTVSDGAKYDLISNFPDASHIFSPVKDLCDLKTVIFPNQYLVVAPSEKRQIGSIFQSKTEGYYFGKSSPLKIELTKLREKNNDGDRGIDGWVGSDFIVAGSYNEFDINEQTPDNQFKFNLRGLNISEPLWTGSKDPYSGVEKFKTFDKDGDTLTKVTGYKDLPDHPFELPASKDNKKEHYPIAADHLLGLGTVPGIRSAFVQRVADPNRPYHPFANPYISVDWNMMDLTVFNGEGTSEDDKQSEFPFYLTDSDNNEIVGLESDGTGSTDTNQLILPKSCFLSEEGSLKFDESNVPNQESVFSSRAWLNPSQAGFLPNALATAENLRRNPWARPVDKKALQESKTAGLQKTTKINNRTKYDKLSDLYTDLPLDSEYIDSVVKIFPWHTLGAYNDAGSRVTKFGNIFSGAANAKDLQKLYYGSPAVDNKNPDEDTDPDPDEDTDPDGDSVREFQPFEFLAWNDAPFSSPAEILLIPASAPGRFGIEFIRKNGSAINLSVKSSGVSDEGGENGDGEKTNCSLGSDAGGNSDNFCGWNTLKNGKLPGTYLNFHLSSDIKGKSLNLGNIFDFITIPSLYMGTKVFSGYDKNLDPVYTPTLREPGKINLNTVSGKKEKPNPGLAGIVGKDFEFFQNFYERRDGDDHEDEKHEGSWFQPAQTAPLKVELDFGNDGTGTDNSDEKKPGNSTILAENLADSKGGNNMFTATEELRKLAGLTTNRSNVFAVWLTVGYFEVEKARPGVNMPLCDPDGVPLYDFESNPPRPGKDPTTGLELTDANGCLSLPPEYKYYNYYRAIYPDGYTYGKELGTDGVDTEGVTRPRAFYLIDRSIPVDFRRGRSWNWKNTILLERKL